MPFTHITVLLTTSTPLPLRHTTVGVHTATHKAPLIQVLFYFLSRPHGSLLSDLPLPSPSVPTTAANITFCKDGDITRADPFNDN